MRKEIRIIQISITIFALVICLIHVAVPNLSIDGITLILLLVAIIPWLTPLIKSVEFPGGLKLEFQDLERIERELERIKLIKPETKKTIKRKSIYSFQDVSEDNPNLALAGLRIEIERILREIARNKHIDFRKKSAYRLLSNLSNKEIFTVEELRIFSELLGILNKGVHAEEIDKRTFAWAMEVGPEILEGLKKKINN